MGRSDRDLIRDALAGEREATRALADRLCPIIQVETAHLLLRCAPAQGRNARQEVEDLVQEVFVHLWSDQGKLLRQWSPERGRSLDSWVRLVARSRGMDILRSRRRTPWVDDPTPLDELEQYGDDDGVTRSAIDRDFLRRLQARLVDVLSGRDWLLFLAVVVEGTPVKQVAAETGMTRDAIYQWRSRFARTILPGIMAELEGHP